MVLDAIGRALEKIKADPRRTVLVSDIGCVGLSDKYFNVHTFHGLHGRSFTYSCGIKLANPNLLVFNLVGDGGCGIGGNHLINAARRNIGIKVLCFNNLNFGMTGGQHSVTTPLGGKTATTPAGSLEKPFDLAGLVSAAGGSFVARVKALDREILDETIAKAFMHDGFAFVDIWEICTAYYMPANDYKKQQMDELIASYGFKTGILREEKGEEYSKMLNKFSSPIPLPSGEGVKGEGWSKPKGISTKFKHNLQKDSIGVIVAGSAGMKVISAAHTFGKAALLCGLHVSQKDDYPVTVQSGHSVSDIKISSRQINYLGIDKPDAVLIISQDGLKEVSDLLPKLDENAIVVYAKGLFEGFGCPAFFSVRRALVAEAGKISPTKVGHPVVKARLVEMNFAGLDKTVHATAALAKYLTLNKFMPVEAFRSAIEAIPKDKIRELNLKAFELGTRLASS
jgi:pyruvate/2-oxoacid:ferredoxin oxidoreductase beta subunit/Pyruvate/2-oxoacid:ferredoxin oxidoreductase gamma subunit